MVPLLHLPHQPHRPHAPTTLTVAHLTISPTVSPTVSPMHSRNTLRKRGGGECGRRFPYLSTPRPAQSSRHDGRVCVAVLPGSGALHPTSLVIQVSAGRCLCRSAWE